MPRIFAVSVIILLLLSAQVSFAQTKPLEIVLRTFGLTEKARTARLARFDSCGSISNSLGTQWRMGLGDLRVSDVSVSLSPDRNVVVCDGGSHASSGLSFGLTFRAVEDGEVSGFVSGLQHFTNGDETKSREWKQPIRFKIIPAAEEITMDLSLCHSDVGGVGTSANVVIPVKKGSLTYGRSDYLGDKYELVVSFDDGSRMSKIEKINVSKMTVSDFDRISGHGLTYINLGSGISAKERSGRNGSMFLRFAGARSPECTF